MAYCDCYGNGWRKDVLNLNQCLEVSQTYAHVTPFTHKHTCTHPPHNIAIGSNGIKEWWNGAGAVKNLSLSLSLYIYIYICKVDTVTSFMDLN